MNKISLLTLLVGAIAGLFGGALGQSGAELMLPALLILGIVPNFKTAVGTVLLAILPPISVLAVLEYYRRGQVKIWTSVLLFAAYFFTAFIGAYVTKTITNRTLEFITGIYFLIISSFFFWNSYTGIYGEKSVNSNKYFSHLLSK